MALFHLLLLHTAIFFSLAHTLSLTPPPTPSKDDLDTPMPQCRMADGRVKCLAENRRDDDAVPAEAVDSARDVDSARRSSERTGVGESWIIGSRVEVRAKRQDFGTCVVGVESACNGADWDADGQEPSEGGGGSATEGENGVKEDGEVSGGS